MSERRELVLPALLQSDLVDAGIMLRVVAQFDPEREEHVLRLIGRYADSLRQINTNHPTTAPTTLCGKVSEPVSD